MCDFCIEKVNNQIYIIIFYSNNKRISQILRNTKSDNDISYSIEKRYLTNQLVNKIGPAELNCFHFQQQQNAKNGNNIEN